MTLLPADPSLQALRAEQRDYLLTLGGHFAPRTASESLPAQDMLMGNVPVRVIRPEAPVRGVYLHIHGGGFMHGSAAMGDAANSRLAQELSVATVSVDYRLAPAHPQPDALADCRQAAEWLAAHAQSLFGTQRLLIGGESVGACLSVLTLLAVRERLGQCPFIAANLVVGIYDFSMTPSQRAATPQHFLSPEHLAEVRVAAFPGLYSDALRDPAISPLYADLHDLPPALFTAGGGDSAVDDSLFMACRWQLAGNLAELALYPESPHLFMTYPTQMAAAANRRISRFLSGCLNR